MRRTMVKSGLMCVLVVLCVLGTSAQAIITDGLQSYWALDGNGNDGQGSVNLTEVNGGSTIGYNTGLVGQAVSVPGVGVGAHSYLESVNAAGDYGVDHEITVSFWYRQTAAVPTATNYHIAQSDYLGLCAYTGGGDGNGVNGFDRDGSTAKHVTIPGGFEAANVWQHRVLRASNIDHTMSAWYATAAAADHVSADAIGSLYYSIDIDGSLKLRMAWNRGGSVDYMYDEVGIWNRKLSDTEIETLFDMGKAGVAIVPEPATMILLGLGACGLLRRKLQ